MRDTRSEYHTVESDAVEGQLLPPQQRKELRRDTLRFARKAFFSEFSSAQSISASERIVELKSDMPIGNFAGLAWRNAGMLVSRSFTTIKRDRIVRERFCRALVVSRQLVAPKYCWRVQ